MCIKNIKIEYKMLNRTLTRAFSVVNKNAKMKLTLRTPYGTLLEDHDEFDNIKGWLHGGTFSIQNKTPPALYVLPPGPLEVRLSKEIEGFSGRVLHNGAFVAVHPDNSCEINMIDSFTKEELSADQLDMWEFPEEDNIEQAKFIKRIRSKTQDTFTRKLF
jgi:hypothetical protein